MSDDYLDQLKADVHGILASSPTLKDARHLIASDGLEGRLENDLATMDDRSGKAGLAIIVLDCEVDGVDENLPGPPLMVLIPIQCIEMIDLNESSDGTGISTATAATRVLQALNHVTLGPHSIYAKEKPITPHKVRAGFKSYLVTLRCNIYPDPAARVASVEEELSDAILVAGTVPSAAKGMLMDAGLEGGRKKFTTDGEPIPDGDTVYPWSTVAWDPDESQWVFSYNSDDATTVQWSSDSDVATPELATGWTAGFSATGTPTFGAKKLLHLTTATSGAQIYYTTDGRFPGPDTGTLYSAPFVLPAAGTIIRAAAHSSSLLPSDVLELTVTP